MNKLIKIIDSINSRVGKAVSWLVLAMVLVQFAIVLLRYVFGWNYIALQESVIYMHALVFMLGSAWALLVDQHVRVDVFYRSASQRTRAWVNLIGSFFLLIPVCLAIWYYSWPYVADSWRILESSREGSGIPAVFLLKTAILFFCAQMALQGLALGLRSYQSLIGAPEVASPSQDAEGKA